MNDKTSHRQTRVSPSERPTDVRSGWPTLIRLNAEINQKSRLMRVLEFVCCCTRLIRTRTYITTREEQASPNPVPRKTLVLDLDETLVHCTFSKVDRADAVLQLLADHQEVLLYVTIRPGVAELLSRAYQHYDLVVFTASRASYADPVIDLIDPKKRIGLRLFRENCQMSQGKLVKDIEQLGKDLSQVIIVDVSGKQNTPESFALHPDNGVLIRSFYDDKADTELRKLAELLEELAPVADVREVLRSHAMSADVSSDLSLRQV